MYPEMFYGVDVRGLCWPDHNINVVVFKPLGCLVGGVLGVIVLLKNPLPLYHLQLFKTFYHSLIQNFTVLLCIHDPLNLCEHSHSIPPHTPPYHKIVPSSMLDCRSCSPVRKWFSLFLPSVNLPSDPILLIFVSSDHNTLLKSSTVQFSWYLANLRCSCLWT